MIAPATEDILTRIWQKMAIVVIYAAWLEVHTTNKFSFHLLNDLFNNQRPVF